VTRLQDSLPVPSPDAPVSPPLSMDAEASSPPLLRVRNLSVSFEGSPAAAVDRVSFDLHPGRTLALVGESGSGKSLLLRALFGALPKTARVQADALVLRDADLAAATARELAALRAGLLAYVPQGMPDALDPGASVGAQLRDVIRLRRSPRARRVAAEAIEALRAIGVAAPEVRARAYPHELCTGARQQVLLARALVNAPVLLLADEPTAGLDAASQALVFDVLRRARGERGLGVLLATHDLGVVAELADDVLVLHAGRAVEAGPVETVLDHPGYPYP
jgi:ABC-type glutathione transport system ATPase component